MINNSDRQSFEIIGNETSSTLTDSIILAGYTSIIYELNTLVEDTERLNQQLELLRQYYNYQQQLVRNRILTIIENYRNSTKPLSIDNLN
ncbi:hypothetical protein QUB80_11085 [Chlorogloeopsis sp. ULAP01]|uniref:hypothetical protein n=1 Tax=Chlorogloeopsis sp. ULAP01 TaxID=3056483 RepID=UPI0025AB339B|nr:hypothetical protein [Chlorogloeopsis sp. ULAP01]MDM9381248.1 hypothetical protein [Chlorogloeopsis sp. ULAP01]